ncbi:helix-turn-helix transcriptional regulator [Alienimonas sp. DA493]|uniref:helix-turn-helix transcriptional regulator n=1 Tax=Alienimonas sp. DA493 TaxID=3373605 RepID=UPI0037548847
MPDDASAADEPSYRVRFGRRIKAIRIEAGLSAVDVANRVGTTRNTMHRWERAEAAPHLDVLPNLAAALGCTVPEMMPDH